MRPFSGDNFTGHFAGRLSVFDLWSKSSLRALLLPGGAVLLGAAVLAHAEWVALPAPSFNFLSYCALLGGMLLAWRFHSSRIFLALLIVYLSQLAIGLLAPANPRVPISPGVALLGVLIPLNFVVISLMQERGFTLSTVAPPLLLMFVQAVFLAVLAGGDQAPVRVRHAAPFALPKYVFVAFAIAAMLLLARSLRSHRPADNAFFWSLAACFLSLYFHPALRISAFYYLAALGILAVSIVETSYLFAYHDELTGLPSRRAFNDALHRLEPPYSVAAVDIDHFKSFNDTYGHDVGDQVLRLVASKLARVTGGGHAYRCGGEEFTILFPGKLTAEVEPHLEQLRATIETAHFHMRGNERRQVPRGAERRSGANRNRTRKGDAIRKLARKNPKDFLSVTVSIGAAASSSSSGTATEETLQAADKALYRAKANGRNRVEMAASRSSGRSRAAGIA
jgi:diguanylate cyclase (GGDEF)-like protein